MEDEQRCRQLSEKTQTPKMQMQTDERARRTNERERSCLYDAEEEDADAGSGTWEKGLSLTLSCVATRAISCLMSLLDQTLDRFNRPIQSQDTANEIELINDKKSVKHQMGVSS
ncbi:hypothetical protein SESBI_34649 [Sesbania bispinosa]|nr:hypothetical protein SESBI_34649 [Sesbania bispinosa]